MTTSKHRTPLVAIALVIAAATLVAVAPPVSAADEVAPTDIGPRDAPCLAANGPEVVRSWGATSNDIVDSIMLGLITGAAREIGGDLTGWGLHTIFGTTTDIQKARQEIAALNAKLDLLNAKVDAMKADMDEKFAAQFTETERAAYDVSAAIYTADAAKLLDYKARMDSWMQADVGSTVDGAQSAVLLDMRNNLGYILQHLNLAMMGTGPGRGLIEIFGSVTFRNQPGFSTGLMTQHEIYTSDYTTPVYDQLAYYKGLAVVAFSMLSEVNHLSWTSAGITYNADPAYVQTYATCLSQFFAAWDAKAAHTVGRLSPKVLVDQRTGLMWTRGNFVAPNGIDDSDDEMAPDHRLCFDCGPTTVAAQVEASNLEALTGWRLPTAAEVGRVLQGRTKKNPSAWLHANSFKWPSFLVNAGEKFRQNRTFYVSDPWSGGGRTSAFITDDIFNKDDDHFWFGRSYPFDNVIAVRVHRAAPTGVLEPDLDLVYKYDLEASVAAPAATPTVATPSFTG